MSARQALDRTIRLIRDAVANSVTDDEIVHRLQSWQVRLIANEKNLRSHAGQTCLVTLASLTVRMGIQVAIDAPEVSLVGAQPPLRGSRLLEALIEFGADTIPGSTITTDPKCSADITFVLGDTPAPSNSAYWRITGTEWAGRIEYMEQEGNVWATAWPIGAMTAAVLAATEIFKAAVALLPLRRVWDEMLAPCHVAEWDFEGDGPIRSFDTPIPVDIISAGAITQSALFSLYRLPLPLAIRIFDDDMNDLTNINRQMLARRSDSGLKADIVARAATHLHSCLSIPEHFTETSAVRSLPLAPFTLIGVDHIPSRWVAQRAVVGWLGVGATSHFEASTSSHERWQSCAGCLHPIDDPEPIEFIPTVSFVSFWAGLSLAVRFVKRLMGTPYLDEHQHLWIGSLRMGDKNAARFEPVAARWNCPVHCANSQYSRDCVFHTHPATDSMTTRPPPVRERRTVT